MSLPAQNPAPQVVATLGQTVIPFSWRCDSSTLINVYVNDTLTGGWTANLNADQVAIPGGTVTLAAGSAAGDVITVERVNPQTQTLALTAYLPFTASALMAALDRMVELLQEIAAKLSVALVMRRSARSKMVSYELPAPSAGTTLGWTTADGGATFSLSNLSSTGGGTGVGVRMKNEIPAGAPSGTTGMDGQATFGLSHTPLGADYLDIFVDGVRADPTWYTRVLNAVTFNSGYIPLTGSIIRADYYY
jgi:hypothetical protein